MMTRLFILIASLWVLGAVQGATIIGYLTATDSTNHVTSVNLVPFNSGHAIGTNYFYAVNQSTRTDTNGYFAFTAIQGDYRLTIANEQPRSLTVPAGTNTYNWLDLLVSTPTYVYRAPGGLVKVSTNDNVFDFLSAKLAAGTSMTLTPSGASNEVLTVALASSVQTAIDAKLPLAGGTLTGAATGTTWTASSYRDVPGTLTHAGTMTLDLSTNTVQSLSVTGAVTLATANLAPGRKYDLVLYGTTTNATVTTPAWRWTSTALTSLASNKLARLTLKAQGANDTNVIARAETEP